MKLLLLGGTADGRNLAAQLHLQGISVIYSIAGLVRIPKVDCEIVVGGFTQFGGLTAYIEQHNISAVLDVTHPYAQKMSSQAVKSAEEIDIPCWRFHRPAWEKQTGDTWLEYNSWNELLAGLKPKKSVFFTAGQLQEKSLTVLGGYQKMGQQQLLRTAVKPKFELPPDMKWIKAIGPFTQEAEGQLLDEHQIDVLVSKNSGGFSTSAKLDAARERAIPVFMLKRPQLPAVDEEFSELAACEKFVVQWFNSLNNKS